MGSGRGAPGGEEAAWRDLIANYAAGPEADGGETPWPERENLPGPQRAGVLPDPGPDTDPSLSLDLSDDTDPALDLGTDPGRSPDPGRGGPGPSGGGPGPSGGAPGPSGGGPGPSAAGPVSRPSPGRPGGPGGTGPPASTGNGPAVTDPAAHGPHSIGRNEGPAPAGPRPRAGRGSSARPARYRRLLRRTGTSCRRSRRPCRRSTRWPRGPGPRCSVVRLSAAGHHGGLGDPGVGRVPGRGRVRRRLRDPGHPDGREPPRDSGPDDGAVL